MITDTLLAKGWTRKPGYWTHADTPESKITVMGEQWWHTVSQFGGRTRMELNSGRGDATLRKHLGYFHRTLSMAGGS